MEGSRSDQESGPSKASPPGEAPPRTGCGCSPSITISITPTTGGQFELHIACTETIDSLKKLISKKLKVPKERICLLHRDRQLRGGTLEENQLMHGAKLTLLPSVETGLLAQRPEQSVMQALESLNDSQVNDFLSGKAPLNLTMRLGDHMMLIQLQLSTVTPSAAGASSSSSSSSTSPTTYSSNRRSTTAGGSSPSTTTATSPSITISSPRTTTGTGSSPSSTAAPSTPISSPSSTGRQNLVSSLSSVISGLERNTRSTHSSNSSNTDTTLASAPKSVIPSSPTSSSSTSSSTSSPSPSSSLISSPLTQSNSNASTSTAATGSCPRCEPRPRTALDTRALAEASRNLTQTLKQLSSEVLTSRSDSEETASSGGSSSGGEGGRSGGGGATATTALNAASSSSSSSSSGATPRPGAIIESMHHHGKGVYSGTFSGTLNPALQDRFGRPKRDISTIIHILNDLLCATPHYRGPAPVHATTSTNASTTSTQASVSEYQVPSASSSLTSGGAVAATTVAATTNSELVAESFQEADEKMETCEPEAVLSRENQATRGKLEQLRLVMEERRARRRARREARSSPYPSPAHPLPLTPTATQWSADGTAGTSQPGQQPPTEPVLA